MDLSLGTLEEATQEAQEEHQREDQYEAEQEDHLHRHQVLGQDLRHHHAGERSDAAAAGGGGGGGGEEEREHMFDKVLTPSDVGKLNRLVVPKQHAERFFPAAGGGAQLCFEDRGGAPWRFRYSYWGSSQSYVMTKGWSRFVRAARLAAGDTVSFSRAGAGAGAGGRRYFIDHRHSPRRRREISFGYAAAATAWPLAACGSRRTDADAGGEGASGGEANVIDTAPVVAAGHDGEVGPSGARSFRLFGFNVECGGDVSATAAAEEEYVDGDCRRGEERERW
ncbi:hypothetical protein ACP4OV_029292 [Aristida adscensionis]